MLIGLTDSKTGERFLINPDCIAHVRAKPMLTDDWAGTFVRERGVSYSYLVVETVEEIEKMVEA